MESSSPDSIHTIMVLKINTEYTIIVVILIDVSRFIVVCWRNSTDCESTLGAIYHGADADKEEISANRRNCVEQS